MLANTLYFSLTHRVGWTEIRKNYFFSWKYQDIVEENIMLTKMYHEVWKKQMDEEDRLKESVDLFKREMLCEWKK